MKKNRTINKALLQWEIRKLCGAPMLIVFLLLCIFFNVLLTAGNRYGAGYAAYVKEARKTTGSRLGAAFDARAKTLQESDYKQAFVEETKGAEDIFETYDPKETAQMYIDKFRITGWAADALEWKYQKQERRVTELAVQDASMDAGAAGMTKQLLDVLFWKLCRAVVTEGLLFAVFTALYVCGNEWIYRTQQTVYASRRGRLVQKEKLAAGALFAAAGYLAAAVISCAVFAAVWQLGDIWKTNMSTQFYYVSSMGLELPFVSWVPFTVRGYLAAVLAMGAIAVLVFYGMGYFCGLVMKNSYAGFLVLCAFLALDFELILLAGDHAQWEVYEAALWSPAAFWLLQPLWFSDMGISALVPWQECWTALLCLGVTGILLAAGLRYFYKRDM